MRRTCLVFAIFVAACGGILRFTGDDEEPPAPPPPTSSADASDEASDGANGEAAVGKDGGFCVPAKTCVDDELLCCSLQATRQTGCTEKCEIACCL